TGRKGAHLHLESFGRLGPHDEGIPEQRALHGERDRSDIQDIRLVQSMFGKHLRIKTKSNQIYIGDVYDMPILEIRNIILGKFHEAQAELVE
ncbi:MAG: hypothetical protein PHP32_00485, partial [Candidatus Izemoplasmatales bacterium]|nr:hypothetical protein [Candidatus Izemoplasmatales bacterium]